MAFRDMTSDWRLQYGYPALAKLPGRLPWKLAPRLGRDPAAIRRATADYLVMRFGEVFPGVDETQRRQWAAAHMDMLALELMDSAAVSRIGTTGGPSIELTGWEHAQSLVDGGRGFIVVLTHFDRLLTAPIALARKGLAMNALTMPVLDNPELSPAHRRFLMRKIETFTQVIRGQYRSSSDSLRPVHEGLRAGQVWIILADVWSPEFNRLRKHPFLGGEISLPTGIERLAQSTGVPLLHAITYSQGPDRFSVVVEPLPDHPKNAMDAVIQRLHHDVRERPWAWWQWGVWDHLWQKSSPEVSLERY